MTPRTAGPQGRQPIITHPRRSASRSPRGAGRSCRTGRAARPCGCAGVLCYRSRWARKGTGTSASAFAKATADKSLRSQSPFLHGRPGRHAPWGPCGPGRAARSWTPRAPPRGVRVERPPGGPVSSSCRFALPSCGSPDRRSTFASRRDKAHCSRSRRRVSAIPAG